MASGPNRAWHCPSGAFLSPLECTECSGGTVPRVTKTLWLAASVEKIPQECWAKISYNWMVIYTWARRGQNGGHKAYIL